MALRRTCEEWAKELLARAGLAVREGIRRMNVRTLYLERPSFWTEDRDPECWRRGLKVLASLEKENGVIRGTPRSLWEKGLKQVMSRRSVLGLFGMAPDREENLLLGAGFLKYDPKLKGWTFSEFARHLAARRSGRQGGPGAFGSCAS